MDEYSERGFVAESIPLGDASIIPLLLSEESRFDAEMARIRAEKRQGVPYLLTSGVRQLAHDPGILEAVGEVLGTRNLVMWGANVKRATPNQAQKWHVDLESLLWPSVTVAVGLSGCRPEGATWCIPGTHLRQAGPPESEPDVLAAGQPQQFSGFGDGRFYLFDARVWHRGDPDQSRNRVVAFLHFQRAEEQRIPWMLDYYRQHWSAEAAPYLNIGSQPANPHVAALPLWYRWQRFRQRWA